MRILWRSSRLGTRQLRQVVIEQGEAVVRPRAGLGVVLDAAGGHVEQPQPLDPDQMRTYVREEDLPGLYPRQGTADAHAAQPEHRRDRRAAGAPAHDGFLLGPRPPG